MSSLFQITLIITINLFLVFNFEKLSNLFNLYDYPTLERKKQKKPVSLLGGFIFFVNFMIFISFDFFQGTNHFFSLLGFNSNIKIIFFLILFTIIYLIGYIDDKINVRPFNRLILLSMITYLIIYYNPNLDIKSIRTVLFDKEIDLFLTGTFFTAICIVTYMNAMNMFDGINLIACLHIASITLVFISNNFFVHFSILLLFSLFVYGYLNIKNLTFLGDSGIYVLSFISAIMIIYFYNVNELKVENILILIFLPMIDFFRLFFLRIYNGKNPFDGDENHLHHYLIKKYNFKKTIFIYICLMFFPILINNFFNNALFLLVIMTGVYFSIINHSKSNKKNL